MAKQIKGKSATKRQTVKRAAKKAASSAAKAKSTAKRREKKTAGSRTVGRGSRASAGPAGKSALSRSAKATSAKRSVTSKAAGRASTTKAAGSGKTMTQRASPGTPPEITGPPEVPRPLPRTHLTPRELKEFRQLLLAKRGELCGDVERLTSEALDAKGRGQGNHSAMPIHMADLGTDNWEQEFTLGLIANEEALVREIDGALARIEEKTYGVCLATHRKISKARLRAKPWAKYCITYARAREEGRVP